MGRADLELEAEVLRHIDDLHAFALHLTRDDQEAERLIVPVIARARELWVHFRVGTDVRVWLFTMLHRAFTDRPEQQREPAPSGARGIAPTRDAPSGADIETAIALDPDGRFYASLSDDEIMLATHALPDDCRSPLLLADLRGFSYAEIAEVLGVPERTARSRLFEGRRILQGTLIGFATATGRLRLPDAPPH